MVRHLRWAGGRPIQAAALRFLRRESQTNQNVWEFLNLFTRRFLFACFFVLIMIFSSIPDSQTPRRRIALNAEQAKKQRNRVASVCPSISGYLLKSGGGKHVGALSMTAHTHTHGLIQRWLLSANIGVCLSAEIWFIKCVGQADAQPSSAAFHSGWRFTAETSRLGPDQLQDNTSC